MRNIDCVQYIVGDEICDRGACLPKGHDGTGNCNYGEVQTAPAALLCCTCDGCSALL